MSGPGAGTAGAAGPDPTTVLLALPSAFQLPSAAVECIAAEAALRFRRVRFTTSKSAHGSLPDLLSSVSGQRGGVCTPLVRIAQPAAAAGSAKAEEVAATSLQDVLDAMKRGNESLWSGLNDVQLSQCVVLSSYVEKRLFPLVWCCILLDDATFAEIAKLFPRPGLFAASLATQRRRAMEILGAAARCRKPEELEEEIVEGFVVLEKLLSNSAVLVTDIASVPFVLGTSSPCAADCYAFAAATTIVHGVFPPSNHSMQKVQLTVRERCPLTVQYAEMVRQLYFLQYEGFHILRPVPNLKQPGEQADPALRGGWVTVLATAIFASVYFIVANADVILTLLQGGESDESDAVGDEAPHAEAHEQTVATPAA